MRHSTEISSSNVRMHEHDLDMSAEYGLMYSQVANDVHNTASLENLATLCATADEVTSPAMQALSTPADTYINSSTRHTGGWIHQARLHADHEAGQRSVSKPGGVRSTPASSNSSGSEDGAKLHSDDSPTRGGIWLRFKLEHSKIPHALDKIFRGHWECCACLGALSTSPAPSPGGVQLAQQSGAESIKNLLGAHVGASHWCDYFLNDG